MNRPTVQQAVNRVLARLPDASAKGPEACIDLFSAFTSELATDAANWVHLESIHCGSSEQAKAVAVELVATDLVGSLKETFQDQGLDDSPWAIEAMAAATRAYYARLAELEAAPQTGGAA